MRALRATTKPPITVVRKVADVRISVGLPPYEADPHTAKTVDILQYYHFIGNHSTPFKPPGARREGWIRCLPSAWSKKRRDELKACDAQASIPRDRHPRHPPCPLSRARGGGGEGGRRQTAVR